MKKILMNKTPSHCHTTESDGHNTIREMVEAAELLGFTEIGISDHLILHPTLDSIDWAMPLDKLDDYVKEIKKVATTSSIIVKLGLEVDFFPHNPRAEELNNILLKYDFDFLIGSIHFIDEFPLDYLKKDWELLTQNEINNIHLQYWKNIKLMVETNLFSFAGHLDLPKKLKFLPTINLEKEIDSALIAIKKAKIPIEINTAGWGKPCKEQYPSKNILQKCIKLDIPIIINDDAHTIKNLGRFYDKTEMLLKNL